MQQTILQHPCGCKIERVEDAVQQSNIPAGAKLNGYESLGRTRVLLLLYNCCNTDTCCRLQYRISTAILCLFPFVNRYAAWNPSHALGISQGDNLSQLLITCAIKIRAKELAVSYQLIIFLVHFMFLDIQGIHDRIT